MKITRIYLSEARDRPRLEPASQKSASQLARMTHFTDGGVFDPIQQNIH
jgi:hypothetical protein